MRNVVWDIETNGLLDKLDRVHSLCIKDLDTGELLSCTDDQQGREMGYKPLREGLRVLSEADKIYGHNIIGFDIPALAKVYPEWTYQGQVIDTLVVASFRFAHIKQIDFKHAKTVKNPKGTFPANMIGRQGLEAWGHRLGEAKGEYKSWCRKNGIDEPFDEWRPEMQTYCEQDLEVNEALIRRLRKSGIPKQAMDIEHRLAWYLSQQERNGWPFDEEKAAELHGVLAARKHELAEELVKEYGWWYAPNGITKPKRTIQYKVSKTNPVPRLIVEGAPYTKIKRVEFNPNSRQHIVKVLKERHGWRPVEFTKKGNPKLDEEVLEGISIPVGKTLMEYLMIDKRLGQLANGNEAWLGHVTTESEAAKVLGVPMIHHRVKQNKAVTHRAAHSKPNAAQVPKVKSDKDGPLMGHDGKYGWECRELWYVPEIIDGEEWVMMGSDAAGLELRCLAHYMARWDGGAYGKAILEGDKSKGTDIHTLNRNALRQTRLPKKLRKYATGLAELSRDDAKTFIYAYLYGAGDAKLGSIVAPGAPQPILRKIGKKIRRTFETKIPALGKLQDAVKDRIKDGWLRMPDGRKTYIRHEHAALNSLLQAAGAIICKAWIVEFDQRLNEELGTRPGGGWDQAWAALGWVHDEVQLAVRKRHESTVSQVLIDSIRYITDLFNWRLPLDGDVDVGRNWAMTH